MAIPLIKDYTTPMKDEYREKKVDWQIDTQKSVLLIHDMQEYFLQFYKADSAMIAALIEHVSSLKQWAKANQIPVFYTAQPAQQDEESRGLLNDMWGPGLTAKPELANVVSALQPDADDKVLTKWRYSAFYSSDLDVQVSAMSRDQLIICGIYAHIGVMQTAADAFMKNIKPFVVADAVADFSRDDHLFALNYVHRNLGVVTTTSDIQAISAV
jgi:bifunctional isochorismate lyase/aryl carrier protein